MLMMPDCTGVCGVTRDAHQKIFFSAAFQFLKVPGKLFGDTVFEMNGVTLTRPFRRCFDSQFHCPESRVTVADLKKLANGMEYCCVSYLPTDKIINMSR